LKQELGWVCCPLQETQPELLWSKNRTVEMKEREGVSKENAAFWSKK